jgi:RimJ/RimL family protein N-acetyltransferase
MKETIMFVRTERLLLRPGWADDASALVDAISHAPVARMLTRAPWPYELADARDFLSRPHTPAAPSFLIFLRTAGKPRLIGGIGLTPQGDAAELGYWITPGHWGLGFATEAGRAVVDMARHSLRLPRLHASHFVDNTASGHVLTKLGFTRTGKIKPMTSSARVGEALEIDYCLELDERSGCVDFMGEGSLLAA